MAQILLLDSKLDWEWMDTTLEPQEKDDILNDVFMIFKVAKVKTAILQHRKHQQALNHSWTV